MVRGGVQGARGGMQGVLHPEGVVTTGRDGCSDGDGVRGGALSMRWGVAIHARFVNIIVNIVVTLSGWREER